jgi:hypothetical protein
MEKNRVRQLTNSAKMQDDKYENNIFLREDSLRLKKRQIETILTKHKSFKTDKNNLKPETMKTLKENTMERNRLSVAEASQVLGGNVCSCSCYYRNVGGSSIEANGGANWQGNKHSVVYTSDAAIMIDDGKGGYTNFWTTP